MDAGVALRLYNEGAFILIDDFPRGAEFGIDMNSWNVGEKFRGMKMIPPGLHFVYYSAVSSEGQVGIRTGFFHFFKKGEVLRRKWDAPTEVLLEACEEGASKDYLREIDQCLAPYAYESKNNGYQKWTSLSNRITEKTLRKLEPSSGPGISASTQTTSTEVSSGINGVNVDVDSRLNFTQISKRRYPPGCVAAEITKYSLDSSFQLETFLTSVEKVDEALAELQFCFLCFLLGQNYESFEHWKMMVAMLCGCVEALSRHTSLFLDFMSDLHFQMAEVPDDFFVDIVSANNFLVQSLTDLFINIRENDDADMKLKSRAISFENHLSRKFGWTFEEEVDDELSPVIIEL